MYTVVRIDDWEALYVDGKLVAENHSLDARVLADWIPELTILDMHESDFERRAEWDGMPEYLEEVD